MNAMSNKITPSIPAPGPIFHAGHCVVDRGALAAAVATAKLVVDKRPTVQILGNLAIIGNDGRAFVKATNLDMTIVIALPACIDDTFAVTMPAHVLDSALAKAAPSDMIAIESFGERLEYRALRGSHDTANMVDGVVREVISQGDALLDFQSAKYRLKSLPFDDFPNEPEPVFSHTFTMSGQDLRELLRATRVAVSTEETRYYLNGIFLHVDAGSPGSLSAVATDGHKLSSKRVALPDGAAGMPGVIVPTAALDLMIRLMKGKACPESVTVRVNERNIRFSFGDMAVTSKLIDGTFPDYHRVVPTSNRYHAMVSASAMQKAVAGVTVLSTERGRMAKLEFDGASCTLTVVDPENGTATARIDAPMVDKANGETSVTIGFNAGYLSSMLSDAVEFGGSDTVTMEMGTDGGPTRITGSDKTWLGILMPMRV